jgi:hypothetical protein
MSFTGQSSRMMMAYRFNGFIPGIWTDFFPLTGLTIAQRTDKKQMTQPLFFSINYRENFFHYLEKHFCAPGQTDDPGSFFPIAILLTYSNIRN